MTPLALDPLDVRSRPAPMRSAPERGLFQRPLVQFGIGGSVVAAIVGVWVALSDFAKPPASEIRIGRVEDWPEIKDGVPELRAAAPAVFVPQAESFAREAAVPAASAATTAVSRDEPAPTISAVEDKTASIRTDRIEQDASRDEIVASAPLPPRRPLQAQVPSQVQDEPRAKKVASAPPPRPAPSGARRDPPAEPAPAAAQKPSPEPAQDNDHVDVLGFKIPTLASTGRKIKQTVQNVGEAVRTLPDRF